MTSQPIEYEVQERNGGRTFAVIRRGPRGGTRFIVAYGNKETAESLVRILSGFTAEEL